MTYDRILGADPPCLHRMMVSDSHTVHEINEFSSSQAVEILAPVSNAEGEQKGHHVDHGIYANEVLLQENPMRFVLFPINHDAIWHMYKKVGVLLPVSCL